MATTTGEKLVELSRLGTGTAMEHLLAITTGLNAPTIYALDIVNTSGIGINDGEITIFASAGTSPYVYSLGGAYQASNSFTGLSDGTYTISVRDVSGYTDTIEGIKLSAPSSESPIITEIISIDASTKTSLDGSIQVIADGGLAPYIYAINDYEYQTSNLFLGLPIGDYSIKVKDSNNVVTRLAGIRIGSKVTIGGGGAVGRRTYRTYVKVNNVKVKDVDLNENIKIKVVI